MKKDIPQYKVADLAIAVVPREENGMVDNDLWDVFVLNLKEEPIENVLVNSRGYGEVEGEPMKTTILRHFFNEIAPQSAMLLEPIQTKLFDIANEFWISLACFILIFLYPVSVIYSFHVCGYSDLLYNILCFFIPPVTAFLRFKASKEFWISLILWFFLFVPSMIYTYYITW